MTFTLKTSVYVCLLKTPLLESWVPGGEPAPVSKLWSPPDYIKPDNPVRSFSCCFGEHQGCYVLGVVLACLCVTVFLEEIQPLISLVSLTASDGFIFNCFFASEPAM